MKLVIMEQGVFEELVKIKDMNEEKAFNKMVDILFDQATELEELKKKIEIRTSKKTKPKVYELVPVKK